MLTYQGEHPNLYTFNDRLLRFESLKGNVPASNTYKMIPQDHKSAGAPSYPFPSKTYKCVKNKKGT